MRTNSWIVLTCFSLAAGLSQFLWLNFAPILSVIEKTFQIPESQASLLLLVFPLIYVFLSVHAGSLTDRKGYRYTLILGTALMAVFAWGRVYFGNFWILLAAQTGIAIAQPYVLNAISKLVLDWFKKEHEAMATGLGTVGMFVGMSLSMATTPIVIDYWGMEMTMALFAIAATVIFVICYLFIKPNPKKKQTYELSTQFWPDLKKLVSNRDLVIVFIVSFLGQGYFNGLTTWLEPIVAPHGMNSAQAGILGGVLIFGGIFGAALIPALSDHFKKRKPFALVCIFMGCLTLWPVGMSSNYNTVLIFSFIQGFFFLPAYALLLEVASELSGAKLAGSATGILMLTGNAGAVIVIIAMEAIKGDMPTFDRGIYFLIGLLVAALALIAVIKEPYRTKTVSNA